MSLEMMIYFAGVADELKGAMRFYFVMALIVTIVAIPIAAMRADMSYGEKGKDFGFYVKQHFAALKWIIVLMPVAGLLQIALPTQKTIYLMAATSVSKEIVQSKGVQTLYDKSFKLLEGKLDEQLKEISK